jgi:N-acetylglucosamine kinase-like BadF-type ATPase
VADLIFADIGGTRIRLYQNQANGFKRLLQVNRTNDPLPLQLNRLLKKLKIKPCALHVGLRGVWTSAERTLWRKKLARLAGRVTVESDVEFAHRLAFGSEEGLLLISGTGSICLGRTNRGKVARSGGLGPMVGDEGSAFWMGREYVLRSGLFTAQQIRRWGKDLELVRRLASFAPKVLTNKTSLCRDIRFEALSHLTKLATDVKTKLRLKNQPRIHLTGGVFTNVSFRKTLSTKLTKSGFLVT